MPLKFCHEKIRTLIRDNFSESLKSAESAVSISEFRSKGFSPKTIRKLTPLAEQILSW